MLLVFSWDFDDLPIHEQWYRMACAYLDSSLRLVSEMIDRRTQDTFHHALVVVHLFEHSIELFLKAAISAAESSVPTHHRAAELLGRYRNLYPAKRFAFHGRIDEAAASDPDSPTNEWARYPVDKDQARWKRNRHIDLEVWGRELAILREDFDRIWLEVRTQHDNAS